MAGKISSQIDKYMEQLTKNKEFSGSILAARGDSIIIEKGYGMANYDLNIQNIPNTKFRIASITKSITAMAVIMLAEQGMLRIEDTLNKYIEDYPAGDKITVHHLLTHTSGIPEIFRDPEFKSFSCKPHTLEELIERFKYRPLEFEPGNKFEYSNSGYSLLAYIIEKVSGKTYEQYIKENIFDKLSMNGTGCFINEQNNNEIATGYIKPEEEVDIGMKQDPSVLCGSGNLYSTVEDIYIWTKALLGAELLSEEYNNRLLHEYGHIEGEYYYGYGKIINRENDKIHYIYQDGGISGYRSIYIIYPEVDLTIIILSNYYSTKIADICEKIEKLIL